LEERKIGRRREGKKEIKVRKENVESRVVNFFLSYTSLWMEGLLWKFRE
jgi:hypothetical protein